MLKISKHLNWYQYSNKLVIRNLRSSEIFLLDASLKDVWLLISKGYERDLIYDQLSQSYETPLHDLIEDIDDVIHVLQNMNLIYTSSHEFDKE